MSYYGWAPYVSVAERRKKAEKAAAKAKKSGADFSPIAAYRGAIAKTFWGKAWSDNLEAYGDYANRLPRGRTYVRNGSVIDLQITAGEVQAQVMGSSLYRVAVKVAAVPAKQWQTIGKDCAGSIDSLVELLQGKLSTAVMQRICTPRTGLFPAPKDISFSCSCPDSASMCKHIAAALYGVGARLDQKPELLFSLRRVDAKDLVSQAGAGLPNSRKGPAAGKLLDDSMLADVFGIEMDEDMLPANDAAKTRKKAAPEINAAKKAPRATKGTTAETSKKPGATRAVTATKSVTAKPPAKDVARHGKSTPNKSTPGKLAGAKGK
ncbi:MAG TPA: SWIM zinc finger family protein [Ramlibacter sp.]|nr:SWIM zinc finger family protein [Ramlibacter sp.]